MDDVTNIIISLDTPLQLKLILIIVIILFQVISEHIKK